MNDKTEIDMDETKVDGPETEARERIRITGCSYAEGWYKDEIGQEFDVLRRGVLNCYIVSRGEKGTAPVNVLDAEPADSIGATSAMAEELKEARRVIEHYRVGQNPGMDDHEMADRFFAEYPKETESMKPEKPEIALPVRYDEESGRIIDASLAAIADMFYIRGGTKRVSNIGQHITHVLNDYPRLAAEVEGQKTQIAEARKVIEHYSAHEAWMSAYHPDIEMTKDRADAYLVKFYGEKE